MFSIRRETAEDRANERHVLDRIHHLFDCKVWKHLRPYSRWDFMSVDSHARAVVLEIKCRDHLYKRFMVDRAKMYYLSEAAREGKRAYLIVWARDVDMVYAHEVRADFEHYTAHQGVGGRYDRNDPDDVDPVVYIDASEFVAL